MTDTAQKPPLFAIFAHPDDEAFGPAGTLATYAKDRDVYLICVTRGNRGKNNDGHADLASVRERELMESAAFLGVKEVFVLDYEDGSLSNNLYHDMAADIQMLIDRYRPDTLLTFDVNGISGHLDHIAVAMVCTFVFYRTDYLTTLLYHVMTVRERAEFHDYFVYMPPGYADDQIDLEVDISAVWETKRNAVCCHRSQKGDMSSMLRLMEKLPKRECFRVLRK
jgi:N-acetyl-1-D-myo-inositol-2-amino-2-deoxy-alpha-D-glucopyranoside deacetylase